jgi:ABC-type polysaccharide/polyol phosphate transport system ATPase subunit
LPSDSDPISVSVQDVCITYRTTFEKRPTLKDAVVRLGRGERAVREVEAVKNVSFDVKQGSVLGIVGSNGAGKSTLVRAIAGILPPTSGRIEARGKVSTLLALGVGFNGAMSGEENVMLGGLAAGYTRAEIAEKYQEIAEFAELGDFMEMPMRTYSSGMFSRLAFAVAVHMEPDILLVDEALSAGDAKFKEKAAEKMNSLVAEARTMILVSHALQTVADMCNDAIWLNKGELMMRGEPQHVIDEYTRFVKVGATAYTLEDM